MVDSQPSVRLLLSSRYDVLNSLGLGLAQRKYMFRDQPVLVFLDNAPYYGSEINGQRGGCVTLVPVDPLCWS